MTTTLAAPTEAPTAPSTPRQAAPAICALTAAALGLPRAEQVYICGVTNTENCPTDITQTENCPKC